MFTCESPYLLCPASVSSCFAITILPVLEAPRCGYEPLLGTNTNDVHLSLDSVLAPNINNHTLKDNTCQALLMDAVVRGNEKPNDLAFRELRFRSVAPHLFGWAGECFVQRTTPRLKYGVALSRGSNINTNTGFVSLGRSRVAAQYDLPLPGSPHSRI